jgi:NCS1 family nucleobase:cation symporter-1
MSVIQLLDYFVFRKKTINVRALYDNTKKSDYYYTAGVNWGAVIIFILSVAVYCILLNPVTWEYKEMFAYTTASLPSCLFCFVAYYIYGKAYIVPKNIGNVKFYEQIKAQ